MLNALSKLIHSGQPALCPINHLTHLSLHPEQTPFPRHEGRMLRWSPRAWVTRGGPQGRAGRWRECANPGHALPSPSRAPSAARSRPAPHAPVASLVACPHGAVPRGLVLLGQGTAASPSRLDHRGPVESHRLCGCHLQMEKKITGIMFGITVWSCCVSLRSSAREKKRPNHQVGREKMRENGVL